MLCLCLLNTFNLRPLPSKYEQFEFFMPVPSRSDASVCTLVIFCAQASQYFMGWCNKKSVKMSLKCCQMSQKLYLLARTHVILWSRVSLVCFVMESNMFWAFTAYGTTIFFLAIFHFRTSFFYTKVPVTQKALVGTY